MSVTKSGYVWFNLLCDHCRTAKYHSKRYYVWEARGDAEIGGWLTARDPQNPTRDSDNPFDVDICPKCLTEWATRQLRKAVSLLSPGTTF